MLLLVCKILGAALTAAGAALKLIKDLSKKKQAGDGNPTDAATRQKLDDKWLKIEVNLIVSGLVISVISISAEQFASNRRAEESRIQTSNQLREIRRLVGQIRTIDAKVTIPLAATNDLFLAMRSYLINCAAPFSNYISLNKNPRLEDLRQRHGITSVGNYDDGSPVLTFQLISDSLPSACANEPSLRPVYDLLQMLASENHQLRFYHGETGPSAHNGRTNIPADTLSFFLYDSKATVAQITASSELLCATSPRIRSAILSYDTSKDSAEIWLYERFPSDFWDRLQPTISRADIARAVIVLIIPEPKKGPLLKDGRAQADILIDGTIFLLPDLRVLTFRDHGMEISNLKGLKKVQERKSQIPIPAFASKYTATLPDLDDY